MYCSNALTRTENDKGSENDRVNFCSYKNWSKLEKPENSGQFKTHKSTAIAINYHTHIHTRVYIYTQKDLHFASKIDCAQNSNRCNCILAINI